MKIAIIGKASASDRFKLDMILEAHYKKTGERIEVVELLFNIDEFVPVEKPNNVNKLKLKK